MFFFFSDTTNTGANSLVHWVEAFKALPELLWIREKNDSSASFIARKLFISHKSCYDCSYFAEASSLQGICYCFFYIINLNLVASSFLFFLHKGR